MHKKIGGKLGTWKSDVTDENLINLNSDIREKRHDWLVLRIYDIMEKGELVMSDAAIEGARQFFDGNRELILRNLEDASKKMGNGFQNVEKFFRFRYDKRIHEIDSVGFDEDIIVGVEVKNHSGKYVKRLRNFVGYAEKKYPLLKRRALFYSGDMGLFMVEGSRKIPL